MSKNLAQYDQLLAQSQLLLSHTLNLSVAANTGGADSSPESRLLADFNHIFDDLTTLCSDFLGAGQSDISNLAEECTDLVGPQRDAYVPAISPNVSDLGGRGSEGGLLLLVRVLSDEAFREQPIVDVYTSYFDDLVSNCESWIFGVLLGPVFR